MLKDKDIEEKTFDPKPDKDDQKKIKSFVRQKS